MSALTVSVTVALLVVLCVNVQVNHIEITLNQYFSKQFLFSVFFLKQESVQMTVEQPNGKADISSFIEENLGSAGDGLNEM